MDTDTACARQQVMLCAKYSSDTKFQRRDKVRRKAETEETRRCLVLPCLLITLTILSWNIDVQIKTILVLILYVRSHYIQVESEPYWHHDLWHSVVNILGTDWGKVCGILDPGPGGRRLRGHKAFFSHWGGSIRNPQILVHWAQNLTRQGHPHSPEFPILCVHSRVVVLTSHSCKTPIKT